MKLIGKTLSPYVRRVALTLEFLEMTYEIEAVSIAEQERLRAYNPVGRVPALVLDDGEVLVDSAAIIDALTEMKGADQTILPTAGAGRRRVLRATALADAALEKAVTAHYETARKANGKCDLDWRAFCLDQATAALAALEMEVAEPFVVGSGPTLADLTVAVALPFIDFAFAPGDIDLATCPRLRAIAQCVHDTPQWERTAP